MSSIFVGTSEDLANLTRPFWKATWWPCGIWYGEHSKTWANLAHHEVACIIFAAAWVECGSGTFWWREADNEYIVRRPDAIKGFETYGGPCLLHAVLAAVEGVG